MGKGGVEQGCDFCAHEVDLHKSFAVFTGPWPDIVKVTWQTELFNACSTKRAFRQRSRFIGVVHDKDDGCKCETTLKCIAAGNSCGITRALVKQVRR